MVKLSLRRASATSSTLLAILFALAQFGAPALAGPPVRPQGEALPDLVIGEARMKSSLQITTQAFADDSCEVIEGCVLPGTRRLLKFDSQIINQGTADAVLGRPEDRPDLYVFSPCHAHYHMVDVLDYSIGYGGVDSVSIYNSATRTFFITNTNAGGVAEFTFTFGSGGSAIPISGDWDGDGDSTIGIYNPATAAFFLKNTNAAGPADLTFTFGVPNSSLLPVVGDWDGDGDTTIGLYNPATGAFVLRNTNAGGVADFTFTFGRGGYLPVAGDWNGDDLDTIGVYDPVTGTYFLKNTNAGGVADVTFRFGTGGSVRPVAGDWDANGVDTIGIYNPATGTYFLKNSNSGGVADATFRFGSGGSTVVPLVGDFDYDRTGPSVPGIAGLKQAFCWLDSARVTGTLPGKFTCSNQGITQGWSDLYGRTLDCQWIDITGLAPGAYQLRAGVNGAQALVAESNYANNVSVVKVRITPAAGARTVPQVRVTSSLAGRTLKAGKPVTITWKIEDGEAIEDQEVWFIPSPKAKHAGHDDDDDNGHDAALAQWKLLAEKLPPTARSFTWVPTEDFVFDYHAKLLIRTNNTRDMIGTDTFTKGRFRVKKR